MKNAILAIALIAAPASAQDTEFVLLQGQAFPADGHPLARTLVFMRVGDRTDSAAVAPNGSFSLVAPLPSVDTIEVFLDAADRERRRYFPPLVRLRRSALSLPLRVVLVPRVWRVEKGTHAGTVAAIGALEAFQPGEDSAAVSSFWWQWMYAFGGRERLGEVFTFAWPAEAYPLPVAFRRREGDRPITGRDSANFWLAVERLERDFGRDFVRPARLDELPGGDSLQVRNAIIVEVDRTIEAAGLGGSYPEGEFLRFGSVKFKDRDMLADVTVVGHELLHALGFGHTCSWLSIMASPQCKRIRRYASVHDVAHAELFFRVHELQRTHDAPHALLAAREGARRFDVTAP